MKLLSSSGGRALPQADSRRVPWFELGSGHVGFVVDKLVLGQVFSRYFSFPCQSFHRLLHTHHPSSGVGTVGQTVAAVPSGLSLTHTKTRGLVPRTGT
jgi:hypothetical protein